MLWGILEHGCLQASCDQSKGHNFGSKPGVYTSPLTETAKGYARAQALFGDGLYYKAYFSLKVNRRNVKWQNHRGGIEWIFHESDVFLHELHITANEALAKGDSRLQGWESYMEKNPKAPNSFCPVDVVVARHKFCSSEW